MVKPMNAMQSSNRLESIPIESFQLGQQLGYDVFAKGGVLLLAKGTVINRKVLRILEMRQQSEVFVRPEDLAPHERKKPPETAEIEVPAKIDDLAEHYAIAKAPPLIDSFSRPNGIEYEGAFMAEALHSRRGDVHELTTQVTEIVATAAEVSGKEIVELTCAYMKRFAKDMDAVVSLSQLPDPSDYLGNHGLQMSMLGMAVACQLRLPAEEVRLTGIAGLLHDVGMRKVPTALLDSPQRLDTVQFLQIKKHPIYSLDLLERVIEIPTLVRLIAYQVHERFDGSGYPRQRDGKKVFLHAKILGMVDAYLAMISDRPYRKAMLPYDAMAQIVQETRLGKWDPAVTRAFLSLLGLFPVGSYIRLADGSTAKVLRSNALNFGRPKVQITHNGNGVPQEGVFVDLALETELNIERPLPSPE